MFLNITPSSNRKTYFARLNIDNDKQNKFYLTYTIIAIKISIYLSFAAPIFKWYPSNFSQDLFQTFPYHCDRYLCEILFNHYLNLTIINKHFITKLFLVFLFCSMHIFVFVLQFYQGLDQYFMQTKVYYKHIHIFKEKTKFIGKLICVQLNYI